MKYGKLQASLRENQGRCPNRRLRSSGYVPGIIYGGNVEPTLISLDHNIMFHALKREDFHTSILTINIDNKSEKVLVKDFQMHAFKPLIMHVDFLRINENEEIQIYIPLHFINAENSKAVKIQKAHITHIINEVEIRALPQNIPHYLEVDLTELEAGNSLHLSDIKVPDTVKLVNLLRGDDAVVANAATIEEEVEKEATPTVAASDIPVVSEEGTDETEEASEDKK